MKTCLSRRRVAGGLVSFMVAAAGSAAAAPADDLSAGFIDPPDAARPHTWWHWMNGNVTREGLTADLEAMKRVGIGGAQIFNVSEGIPDGPAPFMSPQWLELFRHAAAEADRLEMELCFHNCAGWSSSGGPWIKPEHAMQIVVTSEARAKGPARFDAVLKQPETRRDFYRDIAVLAFPTPADDAYRVPDIRPKAGFDSRYGLQPSAGEAPGDAVIARDRVVNLTDRLAAGGRLAWDVPEGDWTILRIGHTPTGKDNHPSPEAGRGLECDKLSREALDAHWAGGIAPILAKLGPLAGKSLNNSLIDSYEVGCNNWTPKFREEFQRLRGYDPMPFLPALTGRVIDGGEVTERFLWDFRRTIGDLFAENYFGYFCELCKRHGLQASIEPYDGPFECLQVGAKADILMGEFWVGGGEPNSVKLAASAAHTHGIRIVGAESFTSAPDRGKWQNHPGAIKALGDLIWCAGVNRFIFHRYAHQPWMDTVPGMTMGQWGTHFERTNTWWEQARAWMRYLARSQHMLQSGRFVADVCFFGGEASPNGGVHRTDLKAQGYDYDAFGTDLVPALAVKDGRIVLPGGGAYRLLVMPDTTWMTPALARKTREIVQAGAVVLARKPRKSPSLSGYPACDAEVARIADEVWGAGAPPLDGEHAFGQGRVIWGRPMEEVLAAMNVRPDLETGARKARLAFIHRATGDADFYFVSNQKREADTVECLFRISGRQPELWDPETGRIEPAPVWRARESRTAVTLDLDPAGSVFVVFRKPAPAGDTVAALSFEAAPSAQPSGRPPPNLEIRKALYGALSVRQSELVDVTDALASRVRDGRLEVAASNDLAGDPAPNVVKELRVEYETDAGKKIASVAENQVLRLPPAGESTTSLRIARAAYGRFREQLKGLPELKAVDITARLAAQVKNGTLVAIANNELAGGDPVYLVPKELRVEYAVDGVTKTVTVEENRELRLPEDFWNLTPPRPRLTVEGPAHRLLAWEAGRFTLTSSSGGTRTVDVPRLPESIDLAGPWALTFQPGRGAPETVTFDTLISWPDHAEAGIRYFSGTATYRTTFTVSADHLGKDKALRLDLGQVRVIAEVRLNGKDLGVLWRAPYCADLTSALRPGKNELEVRVTNLWPNRLIGDEQYPDDCQWRGISIARWPDWFVKGEPRPVKERVTFTTWKHWKKDSPLLPSGLIGPVTIRSGRWVDVKPE